jgi:hypothetical protein
MNSAGTETLATALSKLCGESIAAITFVEDYVQVEVRGGRMSILEPPRVEVQGRVLGHGDPDLAVELRACVGVSIRSIQVDEHRVQVELSNQTVLTIALSEPTGASEAFIYQDAGGRIWVVGTSGRP